MPPAPTTGPLEAGDEERRQRQSRPTPRVGTHRAVEKRAPVRIVVAEDHEGFRLALATFLRSEGFVVTELLNGVELIQMLDSTPPGFFHLVIADHRMPGISGLEALARAGARAPFVILSGADDDRMRASAESFGAAAVLQKPVDLNALLAVVNRVIDDSKRR